MTPDQVYFRLADPKVLRAKSRPGTRQAGVRADGIAVLGEDGTAAARTADGQQIKLRRGGKSLARRLAEEQSGQPRPEYRVEGGEIVFGDSGRSSRKRRGRRRGGDGT